MCHCLEQAVPNPRHALLLRSSGTRLNSQDHASLFSTAKSRPADGTYRQTGPTGSETYRQAGPTLGSGSNRRPACACGRGGCRGLISNGAAPLRPSIWPRVACSAASMCRARRPPAARWRPSRTRPLQARHPTCRSRARGSPAASATMLRESLPGRRRRPAACRRQGSRRGRSRRPVRARCPARSRPSTGDTSSAVGVTERARTAWPRARRSAGQAAMSSRRSLSGGSTMGNTAIRYHKSSRNSPWATIDARSRFVAATIRTFDVDRLFRSHALQPPVLQDAQHPHLGRRRQLADLVEEQRAAVGPLEPAPPGLDRAGERTRS